MFIGAEIVDLELTLIDSAQCFCCARAGNAFGAVIGGKPVWLWAESDGIHAEGGDLAQIRDYLDLERDYSQLVGEYAALPIAARAISMYPGLRILNQEPWDALVTFILSANNNVARIRKLSESLAMAFGQVFESSRGTLYAMPSPERLAACSEDELRMLGVGYRAPYLIQTACRVAEGFPLNALKDMPYAQAHALLLELSGVGDKVADCVLLFGCRHASAFPVDVWVEKLLRCWFGVEAKGRKKLLEAARALFGPHAGLLQQFLFHAARTGGIALEQP